MLQRCLRMAVLLVAVSIAVFACDAAVLAAPSSTYAVSNNALHNQAVQTKTQELQQKYNINIVYPTYTRNGESVSAITAESLNTMEAALDAITPAVVQQVSAHYQRQNGQRLTFAYTYADLRGPYGLVSTQEVIVGGFDNASSRIELYIPRPGESAVATGDNMLTIAHEFGHALHLMIADSYGYDKLRDDWLEIMSGYSFGGGQQDITVFISEYGSTSYEEDFADTFAHAYVCNRAGLGLSNRLTVNYRPTILGRKIAFIEQLIPQHLTDTARSMYNFRRVYSTSTSVSYGGIRLSGTYLTFIEMAEPRSVPLMVLVTLGLDESRTVWISEIGAWYTTDSFGSHVCIFPDGTWGNPGRNLLAA